MNLYGKINPVLGDDVPDDIRRIILFDPSELYQRITIDKYKRWQSLSMSMWPNIPGLCACGCGTKLTGRKTRWADEDHGRVKYNIMRIINGDSAFIRQIMQYYLPDECAKCKRQPYLLDKTWSNGIHVDHIIPVAEGGAGCWLGNYQFLCHVCNLQKGKRLHDKPKPLPISTLFN